MRRFAAIAAAVVMGASAWGASGPATAPATAIFAGGCFWSMESAFEKVYGVIEAVSATRAARRRTPPTTTTRGAVTSRRCSDLRPEPRQLHGAAGRCSGATPIPRMPAASSTTGARTTAPWSTGRATRSGRRRRRRRRRSEDRAGSRRPSSRRSPGRRPSTPPRTTTRTTRRRTPDYERYRVGSGRDEFFATVWGASALADPAAPPLAAKGGAGRSPPTRS